MKCNLMRYIKCRPSSKGRQMFKKPNLIKLYKKQLNKMRTLLLSPFVKQVKLMLIKEIIFKVIEWIFSQGM